LPARFLGKVGVDEALGLDQEVKIVELPLVNPAHIEMTRPPRAVDEIPVPIQLDGIPSVSQARALGVLGTVILAIPGHNLAGQAGPVGHIFEQPREAVANAHMISEHYLGFAARMVTRQITRGIIGDTLGDPAKNGASLFSIIERRTS
jgi:hypothetical protein